LFFLAKNKVFGANGVPQNEPENNGKLEKCAPRVDPFWAPSWGAKSAYSTGLFTFFDPKRS